LAVEKPSAPKNIFLLGPSLIWTDGNGFPAASLSSATLSKLLPSYWKTCCKSDLIPNDVEFVELNDWLG
jgi:hypothetical protein